MKNKYSLEELTKVVNEKLVTISTSSLDKRVSNELTERRIRDYISKGIVSKGNKEGKFVFYNDEHVKEILELRELQNTGYSDRSLANLKLNFMNENMILANSAQSLIGSIKERENKTLASSSMRSLDVVVGNTKFTTEQIVDGVSLTYPSNYDFEKNESQLKKELKKLIKSKIGEDND